MKIIKIQITLLIFSMVLLFGISINAQTKKMVNNQSRQGLNSFKDNDIEFGGMVIDETQSKWGRDFYEYFYSIWQSPTEAEGFTIIITEKPLPSLGSQITVSINDIEVFQQFIQPKTEIIEELVEYAIQYTLDYLNNFAEIQNELNGKDLKGNGIF